MQQNQPESCTVWGSGKEQKDEENSNTGGSGNPESEQKDGGSGNPESEQKDGGSGNPESEQKEGGFPEQKGQENRGKTDARSQDRDKKGLKTKPPKLVLLHASPESESDSTKEKEEGEESASGDGGEIISVTLPPGAPSSDTHDERSKVRAILMLCQSLYRRFISTGQKRADLLTLHTLKHSKKGREGKFSGVVPGILIGDCFSSRTEMVAIGLHSNYTMALDAIGKGEDQRAVSLILPKDRRVTENYFLYFDEGQDSPGKSGGISKSATQALLNCMEDEHAFRVIESSNSRSHGPEPPYFYDGLYWVRRFNSSSSLGYRSGFEYEIIRVENQDTVGWRKENEWNLSNSDITGGQEKKTIPLMSKVGGGKPPEFVYTNKMEYPDALNLKAREGCSCTDKCLPNNCRCIRKNNNEVPYTQDGTILEPRLMLYECGPSCSCGLNCINKITQKGINLPVQVFETDFTGWGVRSSHFVCSGSFICEYVGELINDDQAEQRVGEDEYFFNLGGTNGENDFVIDAKSSGNVGRFINHSCAANLFAQKVLYDHDDSRVPHIMLFAAQHIAPFEEFTLNYHYNIGGICDVEGKSKTKVCQCGASACCGRLY